jgi:hypothetical protein
MVMSWRPHQLGILFGQCEPPVAGQLIRCHALALGLAPESDTAPNGMALCRSRSTKLGVLLAVLFGLFAIVTLKLLPTRDAHA